jgi:hypothetical protein
MKIKLIAMALPVAVLLLGANYTHVEAEAPADAAAQSETEGDSVDPKRIWPTSLTEMAGTYKFLQVGSPGGLWEYLTPSELGQPRKYRQVSINELPEAFRERLLKAEVVISDIQEPSEVSANERLSPAQRGQLRFYREEAPATVAVRFIPGIAGTDEQPDEFQGRVMLRLEHQSHSNPSISGLLHQRQRQEQTWGVATMDYADLTAFTVPPEGADPDEEDGGLVITNARVMRGGMDIFAFVEWIDTSDGSHRAYYGSIRLVRDMPDLPPPARPGEQIT